MHGECCEFECFARGEPECSTTRERYLRERAALPPIVVTRHPALLQHLRELGLAPEGTEVLEHVEHPGDIEGRHVIGVLPLELSARAASVTVVPLALTPADRGQELGIERLREIAGRATRYVVKEV